MERSWGQMLVILNSMGMLTLTALLAEFDSCSTNDKDIQMMHFGKEKLLLMGGSHQQEGSISCWLRQRTMCQIPWVLFLSLRLRVCLLCGW